MMISIHLEGSTSEQSIEQFVDSTHFLWLIVISRRSLTLTANTLEQSRVFALCQSTYSGSRDIYGDL